MSVRISRRKISMFYAKSLIEGVDEKKMASQLAAYLIDNKRTKELDSIIYDIEYQIGKGGLLVVDVVSAHSLNESTRKKISDYVSRVTSASSVQLREHLDSRVLGGVKLEFAGQSIDTTIMGRLNKFKNVKSR